MKHRARSLLEWMDVEPGSIQNRLMDVIGELEILKREYEVSGLLGRAKRVGLDIQLAREALESGNPRFIEKKTRDLILEYKLNPEVAAEALRGFAELRILERDYNRLLHAGLDRKALSHIKPLYKSEG